MKITLDLNEVETKQILVSLLRSYVAEYEGFQKLVTGIDGGPKSQEEIKAYGKILSDGLCRLDCFKKAIDTFEEALLNSVVAG